MSVALDDNNFWHHFIFHNHVGCATIDYLAYVVASIFAKRYREEQSKLLGIRQDILGILSQNPRNCKNIYKKIVCPASNLKSMLDDTAAYICNKLQQDNKLRITDLQQREAKITEYAYLLYEAVHKGAGVAAKIAAEYAEDHITAPSGNEARLGTYNLLWESEYVQLGCTDSIIGIYRASSPGNVIIANMLLAYFLSAFRAYILAKNLDPAKALEHLLSETIYPRLDGSGKYSRLGDVWNIIPNWRKLFCNMQCGHMIGPESEIFDILSAEDARWCVRPFINPQSALS